MNQDKIFLQQAIANSRKSLDEGNFPAGAVVVKDGEILASAVNSPYPSLLHPDSKAIKTAFDQHGLLTGATLYIGLESCLMCTGVAYWAGIRRIVFAISKSKVSGDYYETPADNRPMVKTFNQPIEFVHLKELESEALAVLREWEAKQNQN